MSWKGIFMNKHGKNQALPTRKNSAFNISFLLFFMTFVFGNILGSVDESAIKNDMESEQTLKSWIDNECLQHCAEFAVPPSLVAQHFRIRELQEGTACETGTFIQTKSFSIQNRETWEIMYTYKQDQVKEPNQFPTKLDELILPPGTYRMCVGGGNGAICILLYELSGKPEVEPPASPNSVKSWIDNECVQHCGQLTVEPLTSAQGFKIKSLDSGANCRTGATIQGTAFTIAEEKTGESVFRFIHRIGEDPDERPVKLKDLCLPPGEYRICVGGGKGAVCILEYSLSTKPCAELEHPDEEYVWVEVCPDSHLLPNPYCPKSEKKRFKKGAEPRTKCGIHKEPDPDCTEEEMGIIKSMAAGLEIDLDDLQDDIQFRCDQIDGMSTIEGLQRLRQELSDLNGTRATTTNEIGDMGLEANRFGCRIDDFLAPGLLKKLQKNPEELKWRIYECYNRIDDRIEQLKAGDKTDMEFISEYCTIWKRFLEEITHPGCLIEILGCAEKVGDKYYSKYKYRCKSGFQWNEYSPQPSVYTREQLRQSLENMKSRLGLGGGTTEKPPFEDEGAVVSEYCSVWPRFLKEVTHPGCEIQVQSCGQKQGDRYSFKYKYRCRSGFHWTEYDPQPTVLTFDQVREYLKSMKDRLGID